MADNNNNNQSGISTPAQVTITQVAITQADIEKSLKAVDNYLNQLESGDNLAATSLEEAVQDTCHILNLARQSEHIDRGIALTSLKGLLNRVDQVYDSLNIRRTELQNLMGNTNSASKASQAYLKAQPFKPE